MTMALSIMVRRGGDGFGYRRGRYLRRWIGGLLLWHIATSREVCHGFSEHLLLLSREVESIAAQLSFGCDPPRPLASRERPPSVQTDLTTAP